MEEKKNAYWVSVGKTGKKKDRLKILGEYGRIILKYIFMKQEGVDKIGLAQDRDKRWNVVNAVMKLRVP
jgi:hypothetical protein